MSNCVYTAYGDFACKEDTKKDTKKDTIEHFNTIPTTTTISPYDVYTRYCENCTRSGENITCARCNRYNFSVNTNVKFNRLNCKNNGTNYITNQDGVLTCKTNPTIIPQGSYNNLREHCHLCSNYNNFLRCRCLRNTGHAHQQEIGTAQLDLNNKQCSDIVNDKGVLKCTPIPVIPSVTDCGCWYEFYNNYNKIECNCRTNNRNTIRTKLDLTTCNNRQNLVNRNGTITCG